MGTVSPHYGRRYGVRFCQNYVRLHLCHGGAEEKQLPPLFRNGLQDDLEVVLERRVEHCVAKHASRRTIRDRQGNVEFKATQQSQDCDWKASATPSCKCTRYM